MGDATRRIYAITGENVTNGMVPVDACSTVDLNFGLENITADLER